MTAAARLDAAHRWLAALPPATPLLVVAASREAAGRLLRADVVAGKAGARFGCHRHTLRSAAATIAQPLLQEQGVTPGSRLALETLCARVVHGLAGDPGGLGRFAPVAAKPGLATALRRTFEELRLARLRPADLSGQVDIQRLYTAWLAALEDQRLADPARVLEVAAEAIRTTPHLALAGIPTLLLDVPVHNACERELVAAIAAASPDTLALAPTGDERSRQLLSEALGGHALRLEDSEAGPPALRRLQQHLFDPETPRLADTAGDDSVAILSAPGESRECVELARVLLDQAARGVRFERMAIALRHPSRYAEHVREALARAEIPCWPAPGVRAPDPAGRALLALLACAGEDLSAIRFAEYLSLGELPVADEAGEPPAARPPELRWEPPDDDGLPRVASWDDDVADVLPEDALLPPEALEAPVVAGRLKAPRHWERLLGEAAVIGGRGRWERRLEGLAQKLALDGRALDDPDDPTHERIARQLTDLGALRTFALPLLDRLEPLRHGTGTWRWGEWLDALTELADRALRDPTRVLRVLSELEPLRPVGPVSLAEVRLALHERLTELVVRPGAQSAGSVLVTDVEGLRGMSFDVVLVPGVAERGFPEKIREDPILLDRARRELAVSQPAAAELPTNADRAASERLALQVAVGAATTQLVISYPRLDLQQARPRVPSFYGLEVLRAVTGRLPDFAELARQAESTGEGRAGWPAPADPARAIDDAEYDLSELRRLVLLPAAERAGVVHYLLDTNNHLKRALRARARRWLRRWTAADGLVDPSDLAKAALATHRLDQRSFSATALQKYAQCPYAFLLYTVHRLAPRQVPEAIERMDPLQRGSLFHEAQFEALQAMRAQQLLPVDASRRAQARAVVDAALDAVAARYRDELFPAIARVWEDGIDAMRADLRQWLTRMEEAPEWLPLRFELAFGLKGRQDDRDAASQTDPVALDCGIQLRGSIDLVEQGPGGRQRATDHKTGRAPSAKGAEGMYIDGGERLQPVLYALALEKLSGAEVVGGQLYFCTDRGGFRRVDVPLDAFARHAADRVATSVAEALEAGFLPAYPRDGACDYCDYQVVCGPNEGERTSRKRTDRLGALLHLRDTP